MTLDWERPRVVTFPHPKLEVRMLLNTGDGSAASCGARSSAASQGNSSAKLRRSLLIGPNRRRGTRGGHELQRESENAGSDV